MKLNEFVEEQKQRLEKFKEYWIEMANKDPKNFPMNFDADNSGIWFEQFQIFDE